MSRDMIRFAMKNFADKNLNVYFKSFKFKI